jgi:hypothetical protein
MNTSSTDFKQLISCEEQDTVARIQYCQWFCCFMLEGGSRMVVRVAFKMKHPVFRAIAQTDVCFFPQNPSLIPGVMGLLWTKRHWGTFFFYYLNPLPQLSFIIVPTTVSPAFQTRKISEPLPTVEVSRSIRKSAVFRSIKFTLCNNPRFALKRL